MPFEMKIKSVLKDILKFSLLVVATTMAFVVASALLPYSEAFKEANKNADPSVLLYVILANAWICFTIIFVVRHSSWRSNALMPGLTATLFFVYAFMTQIETYFFGEAFPSLTNTDIVLITISNGVSIFVGVPLGTKLFGKKEQAIQSISKPFLNVNELMIKLSLIGIMYVIVYFVFGYFVAWQVEELRVFYSGQTEDPGFIASWINNYHERPIIYPFQFVRGVLFGLFVLPLVSMFKGQSRYLLASLVLVYTGTGISLIIPNPLFPDSVRWAHFREMISSMFFFSFVVWWIYEKLNWRKKRTETQDVLTAN